MTAVRAVLFDLDHTLFDTARTERIALGRVARSYGFRLSGDAFDAYQEANLRTWAEYRSGVITSERLRALRFERWFEAMGRDPAAASEFGRRYLNEFSLRGDLIPGAKTALRSLERRGFRLGVVTNGIDRVQRLRLRRGEIHAYFRGRVVTSERAGSAKPDPRIMFAALERIRCLPSEAVYVGDDPDVDGRAAQDAGMRFVWFDPSGRRAAATRVWRRAASLEALPAIVND